MLEFAFVGLLNRPLWQINVASAVSLFHAGVAQHSEGQDDRQYIKEGLDKLLADAEKRRQEDESFTISRANSSNVGRLFKTVGISDGLEFVQKPLALPRPGIAPTIEMFVWADQETEALQREALTGHIQECLGEALTDHFKVFSTHSHPKLLSIYTPIKVTGTSDVVVALDRYYESPVVQNGMCICFELEKDLSDAKLKGALLR